MNTVIQTEDGEFVAGYGMSYRIKLVIDDKYEMNFTAVPDPEHYYAGYYMGAATSREYYENRSNMESSGFHLIVLPDGINIGSVYMLVDKWNIVCVEKEGEKHLVFTYIVHPDANRPHMGSLDDEISQEVKLGKIILKDEQLFLVTKSCELQFLRKL